MKKLFRKSVSAMLVLVMCLTAMTGCNSSKESDEDGAADAILFRSQWRQHCYKEKIGFI